MSGRHSLTVTIVVGVWTLKVPLACLGWSPLKKELGRIAASKGKEWVRTAIATLVSAGPDVCVCVCMRGRWG
jgi:hypothetical protein